MVFPEVFVGGFPRGSDFGVTIGGPPQAKGRKGKDLFCKYYAGGMVIERRAVALRARIG